MTYQISSMQLDFQLIGQRLDCIQFSSKIGKFNPRCSIKNKIFFSVEILSSQKSIRCIYFKKSHQVRVFCRDRQTGYQVISQIRKAVLMTFGIHIGRPEILKKKCQTVKVTGNVGFKVDVKNLSQYDYDYNLEENTRNSSYRYNLKFEDQKKYFLFFENGQYTYTANSVDAIEKDIPYIIAFMQQIRVIDPEDSQIYSELPHSINEYQLEEELESFEL